MMENDEMRVGMLLSQLQQMPDVEAYVLRNMVWHMTLGRWSVERLCDVYSREANKLNRTGDRMRFVANVLRKLNGTYEEER